MSSTNPRVSVTLRPKTAAILRRLSVASGKSISSLIADLLEDSEGVYERAVRTMEAARTAMDQARAEAVQGQKDDYSAIHKRFGLEDADFEEIEADERQSDLLDSAETIKRRSARAVQPPSLTGGSQTLAAPRVAGSKSTTKPRQQRKGGKNGAI